VLHGSERNAWKAFSKTFSLPLGVQAFSSQYSVDTAKVLAFTSLSMIPALVFFSLFERPIVGGLTGAVKG
jgi:raffinose/stachyose/melibiose transport system permease protein